MIIAISGHRPNKLFGYDLTNTKYDFIRNELKAILQELKATKVISGMALGVDTIAAETCIELKIPFVAAVPFADQKKVWPQTSQVRYKELLAQACEIVIVCEGEYAAWKLQKRNEWMVDRCDKLIACWNGDLSGGTYNCIQYAEKINKKVIRIDPYGKI